MGIFRIRVSVRTGHDHGTGGHHVFSHLNADGLQADLRLHIPGGTEGIQNGPGRMALTAAYEYLIRRLPDVDGSSRPDPFRQGAGFIDQQHHIFLLDQIVDQLVVFWKGGQKSDAHRALQDAFLHGGRALFVKLQLHMGEAALEPGIEEQLHAPLDRDPQADLSKFLIAQLLDLLGQVGGDGADLLGRLHVKGSGRGQGDGVRVPIEDRRSQVGLGGLYDLA